MPQRKSCHTTLLYVAVGLLSILMNRVAASPDVEPNSEHQFTDEGEHHSLLKRQSAAVIQSARFDQHNYNFAESATNAQVCVRFEVVSEGATHVDFTVLSTESGTATERLDYQKVNYTFFASSYGRECVQITVVDDTDLENQEYFYLQLSAGGRIYGTSTIYIQDTNGAARLELSPPTVDEGVGSMEVCAIFTLSEHTIVTNATLLTRSGTATEGVDYSSVNHTFSVSDRIWEECVTITVVDDTRLERRKYFHTDLRVDGYAYRSRAVYVQDNDGEFRLEQSSYYVNEGTHLVQICATFEVNEGTTSSEWVLRAGFSYGTATVDVDYMRQSVPFDIVSPGGRKCISIEVINDAIVERREYFIVELLLESTRVSSAAVYLQDNDIVELEQSSYTVQESSGSVEVCAIFELNATIGADQIEASLITTDGLSTEEMDYIGMSHSFAVSSPGGRECINIRVVDDADIELQEYFTVRLLLEGSTHRTATVYIQDNDKIELERSSFIIEESSTSVPVCAVIQLNSVVPESNTEVSLSSVEGYGTAEVRTDYFGASRTFTPHTSSGRECITIMILDDTIAENLEYIHVELRVDDRLQEMGNIYIKDSDIIMATLEQSVYNVNEDIAFVEVCANLKTKIGTSSSQWMLTTVPYTSASATEGVDYIGVHRTFTVHSPETKQCINIEIVDDNELENNEIIFIQLRFGSVEWSRATVHITDNDGGFTLSSSSVNENAGFMEICGDFNINTQKIATFRTQSGSARDGVDFVGLRYSTTVSPGEKKCVNITILDDVEREHTQEYFRVYLRVDSQERGHYRYNIYDDDSNIFQQSLHTITESTGFVRVCLEYTDITTAEIVTARNGTATENQDYVPVTHTFTASSDGMECITITILNDVEIEYKEHIPVELRYSGIVYNTSYVIIEDDDTARLERSSYTVKEGDIFAEVCAIVETIYENDLENFEVTLSTLQDWIGSDFATEGHDYIGTSRTFINPRGRECISIGIVDDTELEFRESFQVQLKVGARYIQSATIRIEDSVITLQSASANEGAGFSEVCATFRGTANTEANIWTNYGSARPADYIQVGHSFNVSSPQQRECINITLVDDADLEIRESFTVYLSVGNLQYSSRSLRLSDNDGVATLEQSSYTVNESSGCVEICASIDINQGTNKPTMNLYTVSGSAKDGSDFIGMRHIFNVSSLSQKECFNIAIIDDKIVELRERFRVYLRDLNSRRVFDSVNVYILDNDGLILSLETNTYSISESDSDGVSVCVVALRGDGSERVTAILSTQDSTAIGGEDYSATTETIAGIASGDKMCLSISIIDDTLVENTEQFLIVLDTPDAVDLNITVAMIEIINDDEQVTCTPPCVNGECVSPGVCKCEIGWTAADCSADINECEIEAHNCSRVGPASAECVNTAGGFRCSCDHHDGYVLNSTNHVYCEDINECTAGSHNCSSSGPVTAVCVNLLGDFRCSCDANPGYVLEATTASCMDVNECDIANGGCEHSCINTEGSFRCECNEGYTINGLQCKDVNECEERTHSCSLEEPAPACINTPGGFRCSCDDHSGYRLILTKCEDVDECTEGISACNQICTNTKGSYVCLCQRGYTLSDDDKTCDDVNECGLNNGGCEQLCINTPGSYQCKCGDGFRLISDNHSCEALPCMMLSAPLNGTISCSAQTTDGVCNFSCNNGFDLVGSQMRTCLSSATWSGSATFCQPGLCETLEAPDNGVVLFPCTREYTTSCAIQCKSGYKIDELWSHEQTCILESERDELKWTDPPICIESNICEPNPCKHDGICSQRSDATFACNCEGTGYTGPTCNVGIVSTPVVPTLMKNNVSGSLVISAKPDNELIISISGGNSIRVLPQQIKLTSHTATAFFTVTGISAGYYSIRYQLSGADANTFITPEDTAVFVQDTTPNRPPNKYFQELGLSLGNLTDSCCMPNLEFQCPGSDVVSRVELRSACQWTSAALGNSLATPGVVFAANQDFKLPISIAGIQVDNRTTSFITSLPQVALGSCTPCPEVQSMCSRPNRNSRPSCYCYNFTISDTLDFLRTRSLAQNYIRTVRRHLLPSWFKGLQVLVSNQNDQNFAEYEYTTELVAVDNIQRLDNCEMIDPDMPGLYSVLRYGRALRAIIESGSGDKMLAYSERQSGLEIPMCFAINLCMGYASPVFIQLSPPAHDVILSRLLREYTHTRNWDIILHSITLFKDGRELNDVVAGEYWSGVSRFQPRLPRTDMSMKTDLQVQFQSGDLKIDVMFSGRVHYAYKERDGVIIGEIAVSITYMVATDNSNLHLSLKNNPSTAVVNISDVSIHELCSQQHPRPSGIALNLIYRQRPEQEFFSRLLSFSEESTECPFDAFINLDDNLELKGLSLYTDCPHLNLGRLTFSRMSHKFYFNEAGGFAQYCLPDSSITTTRPALLIQSTLKGNELPMGYFMTLLSPEQNPVALSIEYNEESGNLYAQMGHVGVSFLGTILNTSVTVSSNLLQFSTNTDIFDTYSAYLSVSAPVDEAPWERLPITVTGVMDRETRTENSSFIKLAENSIHRELFRISELAFRRETTTIMALNRSRMQFLNVERRLNDSIITLQNANKSYQESLALVEATNNTLNLVEIDFRNASDEVTQLQQNFDTVCSERQCEEVCVKTNSCSICYVPKDIEKTTTCPYTVNEIRQFRVSPFYEERDVWKWITECRTQTDCPATTVCQRVEVEICNVVCRFVRERVPVYNWAGRAVPVLRYRNCTQQTYTGSIPTTCCVEETCVITRPNSSCVSENIVCRMIRKQGFDELERAQRDIVQPFLVLDEARRNLSIARIKASEAKDHLRSSQQTLDQLIPVYESARAARDIAEASYENAVIAIKAGLTIHNLLMEHPLASAILKISNVTFNTTLLRVSPTQLPLLITYTTPYNGKLYEALVQFNFMIPQALMFGDIAQEIIEEAFRNASMITKRATTNYKLPKYRGRRQSDPESAEDENRLEFEQNCADLQNVKTFLLEIAESLVQVSDSMQDAKMSIDQESDDQSQINVLDALSSVNFTVFQRAFNVTVNYTKTIEELTDGLDQDEELDAYISLVDDQNQITAEMLQAAENNAFSDWQARLEILYNQSGSVGRHPCYSLADCLVTAADILEQLVEATPGDTAQALLQQILMTRDALLQIGTAMDLTIPQTIEKLAPFLNILQQYMENEYWCAALPLITLQPPAEVNVSVNGMLTIKCDAEAELPLQYQWKKDGNSIPGATTNTLTVTNVQRYDYGNYTCQVSNPVGGVQSINASVFVYEAPDFYLTPVPTSVYEGTDNGAWLACNATAWPYPGWRWYFGTSRDTVTLIEGENTNELLILDPQKRHEGWYTCEAYNGHGNITADLVYLRVLPVTVSQQSVPIDFKIANLDVSVNDSQCRVVENLQGLVQNAVMEVIDSDTTIISNFVLLQISDSSYTVMFSLASKNVTGNETHTSTIIEIANRALPTRVGLQRSKELLQSFIQQPDFRIVCGQTYYSLVPGTFTEQKVTYICPPGQQINRNFLLCVSCEPGSYSSYTVKNRVLAQHPIQYFFYRGCHCNTPEVLEGATPTSFRVLKV